MKEYSFEKLEVWKLSTEFTLKVYEVTKDFPDAEKFGMTNQLRRAAVSIPNNLAEGSGRTSAKDKAKFTQIAFGSLMECLNLIILSNKLHYLDDDIIGSLRNNIDIIAKKLSNLRRTQLNP